MVREVKRLGPNVLLGDAAQTITFSGIISPDIEHPMTRPVTHGTWANFPIVRQP